MERYDSDGPAPHPNVAGWPRVHTAIRRGGFFLIEASTPNVSLMLKFCPGQPEAGRYEIRRGRYEDVERGHTVRLKEVPSDETDNRVSMLTPFVIRYFIVTEPEIAHRTRLVWLLGLSNFRAVEEGEAGEDETS